MVDILSSSVKSATELRIQGEFKLAMDILKNLMTSLSIKETANLLIDAMNELVLCHRAFDEYEEAMELSIEIISLCNEKNYPIGKARAFTNLGALTHISGSFDQAKDFFRQSLKIGEQYNDPLIIARNLIHIGLVARDEGRIEKADGNFYSAYKILENHFDTDEAFNLSINALNHLGLSQLIQGHYSETITRFNQALSLIGENFNYVKKPLITRNLSLCYKIIDHEKSSYFIEESLNSMIQKKSEYSKDLILSSIYKIIYLFEEREYEKALKMIGERNIEVKKQPNQKLMFFLLRILINNEQKVLEIEDAKNEAENYYRQNEELLGSSKKLFLLHIEFFRLLTEQTVATVRNYSFGISRKFENLIRIARGHKESRIFLLCYTFLLEQMLPTIGVDETQLAELNKDTIFNLVKQIKFDLKDNQLSHYFEVLEILINLFYTMEFPKNIKLLTGLKQKFANNKERLTEREIVIFNLEVDFTEMLSKLAEVSDNAAEVRRLIIGYQREIREIIFKEIRYFRFKIIHILYLLNTFALH